MREAAWVLAIMHSSHTAMSPGGTPNYRYRYAFAQQAEIVIGNASPAEEAAAWPGWAAVLGCSGANLCFSQTPHLVSLACMKPRNPDHCHSSTIASITSAVLHVRHFEEPLDGWYLVL